jgi:hypothetical protein
MKLTNEKAIELSIKKWEFIVDNDGSSALLIFDIPELQDFSAHCGLCEFNDRSGDGFCVECPIGGENMSCGYREHAWYKWEECRTKENAQKVLDLIKSIK